MATKATPKPLENQALGRRQPRQARALHKVELMLESAMRLIDQLGINGLATNAVAETAGVSIGTLYQYFNDKQGLLDALAQRELAALGERVKASLTGAPPATRGGRIAAVMQAVLASYGGRRQVHRRVLEHALSRGPGTRLNPLYSQIAALLVGGEVKGPGDEAVALSPAEAFVLTHALAGVMRALVSGIDGALPRQELEASLVRLVTGFVGPPR